jgi:hypothetical protein
VVSGQFHTPASLPQQKELAVPIGQEAEWAPESAWTLRRREHFLSLQEIESWPCIPLWYAVRTELSWFRHKKIKIHKINKLMESYTIRNDSLRELKIAASEIQFLKMPLVLQTHFLERRIWLNDWTWIPPCTVMSWCLIRHSHTCTFTTPAEDPEVFSIKSYRSMTKVQFTV